MNSVSTDVTTSYAESVGISGIAEGKISTSLKQSSVRSLPQPNLFDRQVKQRVELKRHEAGEKTAKSGTGGSDRRAGWPRLTVTASVATEEARMNEIIVGRELLSAYRWRRS